MLLSDNAARLCFGGYRPSVGTTDEVVGGFLSRIHAFYVFANSPSGRIQMSDFGLRCCFYAKGVLGRKGVKCGSLSLIHSTVLKSLNKVNGT